ncbi:hypothetical protein C7H19_17830 [Aphanothece hegewaldii CCALA 016]|uniref:DUF1269 domain-containing family protein n=1 Tax=Aphanothece hegewaldii CCALA 016 TaxID=2107694 RepID=A0A2T1LUJ1_9CHRO|nr:DUF1269 domain-containing protein [Aphanothece hegewaldii]PSF35005.1 hypothetical protein C7H19_17830 [Aphanothece hegewaldii CCALA 016]
MSELIVVAFSKIHKADEVVLESLKQDKATLEGVEDAVVLTKDEAGKIRVKPYYDILADHREVKSEFWGTLISTLLTNFDNENYEKIGITREDVSKLQEMLEPDSSAIFVLRQKFNTESLIERIKKYEGKVLYLSLNQETDQELLNAINQKNEAN